MEIQSWEQFNCLGCDEPHVLTDWGAVVFGMIYKVDGGKRNLKDLNKAIRNYQDKHLDLDVHVDGDTNLILGTEPYTTV